MDPAAIMQASHPASATFNQFEYDDEVEDELTNDPTSAHSNNTSATHPNQQQPSAGAKPPIIRGAKYVSLSLPPSLPPSLLLLPAGPAATTFPPFSPLLSRLSSRALADGVLTPFLLSCSSASYRALLSRHRTRTAILPTNYRPAYAPCTPSH